MWPCFVKNFFIIKPTRCTNFPDLLRHETLHVSGSSSVHHQEFIHCTLYTVHKFPPWSFSKAVYKTVWHIPVPSVQWINSWWRTEELPETCRVSCRSKFGKFVHLVGFIINKILFYICHSQVGNTSRHRCHDVVVCIPRHSEQHGSVVLENCNVA